MTVKIGVNPLSWTNDDLPSLGSHIPLEQCLSEGKEAGYQGFELGNKFPRDPCVLQPLMQAYDLEIISGWFSLELLNNSVESQIQKSQDHIKLLKAMNCTIFIACEVSGAIHSDINTPLSKSPRMNEQDWCRLTSRLNEFSDYLLSEGLQLAYHHHMGTVIESEADVDRLMSSTSESVGLLLDTGHITYSGGSPLNLIDQFGGRICHVHCKDIRPQVLEESRREDWSFLNSVLAGVFTVPGDGFINYRELAVSLASINYSGWLVVEAEQDPSLADPFTYVSNGFQHLRNAVTEARL
ncbi:myo-inosose-2 dehydratase [Porticoccus sp. W117]|uniref:myo-inosose-2 dehydratase n=1 Tax=Porticoccus sp. W117 TaxID=3054777 RepID=UPI0025981430|nr:myo-inosose-2 dehydratase [Porticoccus sp. W117]MDM3870090.1 myo-inosose-2 dehydratase [Porticoccus sp. W117]